MEDWAGVDLKFGGGGSLYYLTDKTFNFGCTLYKAVGLKHITTYLDIFDEGKKFNHLGDALDYVGVDSKVGKEVS